MHEKMVFPETLEEFVEMYKYNDSDCIVTGIDVIPVFRIKQWIYHEKEQSDSVLKENDNGN